MNRILVVLSGGMDSYTLLHLAVRSGPFVEAVSFDYNQRHGKELSYAEAQCRALEATHRIVPADALTTLPGSSLTDADVEVPHGHYEEESMKATVVPNRNMNLLAAAASIALAGNFDTLAIGVHAGDHAIYPDCRPEFIEAMQRALNLGNWKQVTLWAPFLHYTKTDIARLGASWDLDYGFAWTCYEGGEEPCRKCGACQERIEAVHESGALDTLYF